MGKTMFKMWRSKAPEPPFVNQIYGMLTENHPDRKDLIRKQLKDEYGVDPIRDATKRMSEPVPTGQQMVDSLLPDMIFYPENPLRPGEAPSGATVRGVIGHETMFVVTQHILEGRVQKSWTQGFDSGQPRFGDHTIMLLALLDAGIAQNLNESHRAESSTLGDNEKMIKSQLSDLERRVKGGEESFLFIPLESFYYNIPHAIVKSMLNIMFKNQATLIGKIMEGYTGTRV